MTNKLNPRMSCDVNYRPSIQLQLQNSQSSTNIKQLIQYLKSNPNIDINQKLREEVFFKKIHSLKNDIKDGIKSSSQQKYCRENQKFVHEEKKFINKTQNRKKLGFFSPKEQPTNQGKYETSPFVLFNKEINQQIAKKTTKLRREVQSLDNDIVFSQRELPSQRKTNQCPHFLKKTPKTTSYIPLQNRFQQTTIKDFHIIKTLGQGTFGDVFCAVHLQTLSIFTIKSYKKQIIKSHELQDKIIHDIKTQVRLLHPHIVKLYGVFADETYFYMIFEYMESGNLGKTIQQKGGQLTELQVCRKIFQINDALLFLHQKGLIHRDIKPVSILTCLNVCKLCDTEWVQQSHNRSTRYNTLCKEIDYTAPQALQGKEITAEFDMWGLGLIAFQLLTGHKFIVGNTQKSLIRKIITLNKQLIQVMLPKDCSPDLSHLILASLKPIPSKRLKSKEINQMKLQKQKEVATNLMLAAKNLSFSQKIIILPEKIQKEQKKWSPTNTDVMFGVKKEIKSEILKLV